MKLDDIDPAAVSKNFEAAKAKAASAEAGSIEAAEAMDCADCAICAVDCCDIDEYYLVHDDLWKEFGVVHGMLCVGCLEQRMGRQLTPADFKERVGINGPDESRSTRLESRMTPALQIATPPIA